VHSLCKVVRIGLSNPMTISTTEVLPKTLSKQVEKLLIAKLHQDIQKWVIMDTYK